MTTIAERRTIGSTSTAARIVLLVTCVAASFIPGAVGSRFEPGAWYSRLDKAALTPPSWVFPVVWPVLYLMMGVALWRFVESGAPRARRVAGVTMFAVQLVLNGLWSYLFFGLRRPDLALLEIVVLWLAIVAVLVAFVRHDRGAASLLVPYLAWVTFATYLNFEVWRMQ